jgi:hypothetical protein
MVARDVDPMIEVLVAGPQLLREPEVLEEAVGVRLLAEVEDESRIEADAEAEPREVSAPGLRDGLAGRAPSDLSIRLSAQAAGQDLHDPRGDGDERTDHEPHARCSCKRPDASVANQIALRSRRA